jgi:hypothetical protein
VGRIGGFGGRIEDPRDSGQRGLRGRVQAIAKIRCKSATEQSPALHFSGAGLATLNFGAA